MDRVAAGLSEMQLSSLASAGSAVITPFTPAPHTPRRVLSGHDLKAGRADLTPNAGTQNLLHGSGADELDAGAPAGPP